MSEYRPILVVNFAQNDRDRIIATLETLNMRCTEVQAEEIRLHLTPLPDDDAKLLARLFDCVEVDWDQCPEKLEPTLRSLAERYNAGTFRQKQAAEREMLAVTKGLSEHPEWWTFPCLCDSCREYAE